MFFSGIREIASAFGSHPPPSNIADQVGVIRSLSQEQGQMGFFRGKAKAQAEEAVSRVLKERGKPVADVDKTVEYLKAEEERAAIRRRFVMQAIITFVVLAFAIGSLTLGAVSEATAKALFGLIGTVIGYWLK